MCGNRAVAQRRTSGSPIQNETADFRNERSFLEGEPETGRRVARCLRWGDDRSIAGEMLRELVRAANSWWQCRRLARFTGAKAAWEQRGSLSHPISRLGVYARATRSD
jgi:hypothetical protein